MHGTSNRGDSRLRLLVSQQGDIAEIRVEKQRVSFRWSMGWQQHNGVSLEIGIPKQFAGKLSVEGVSSDITLQNHTYSDLALKTISGDIETDGALAITGGADAHTVSGDVALSFSTMPNSIAVKTVSGDVHLAVPANAQYSLETHSVSGDVTSDSPATNSQPGSKGTIKANTVSGDIRITRSGGI